MADINKKWLQSEGKDWFTAAQIKVAKAGSSFSFGRSESAAVLEKLAANGYLLSESRELPKAGKSTIYLPRISAKKALDAVIPLRPDANLTCMEENKWSAMRSRMSPESSRTLNLGTLTKAYKTKEVTTRKRGEPSKKKGTEQEEYATLAEDLALDADREAEFFLEILKLVESNEMTDAGLVPVHWQYFYPVEGRCRRYLQEKRCSRLAKPICRPGRATSMCMPQCSPLWSSLPMRYSRTIWTSGRGEKRHPIGRKTARRSSNAPNMKANKS